MDPSCCTQKLSECTRGIFLGFNSGEGVKGVKDYGLRATRAMKADKRVAVALRHCALCGCYDWTPHPANQLNSLCQYQMVYSGLLTNFAVSLNSHSVCLDPEVLVCYSRVGLRKLWVLPDWEAGDRSLRGSCMSQEENLSRAVVRVASRISIGQEGIYGMF